jgi:hypothetical protein
MAEDNANVPSLDELVFFEDDALADFADGLKDRDPIEDFDPTADNTDEDTQIELDDDTTDNLDDSDDNSTDDHDLNRSGDELEDSDLEEDDDNEEEVEHSEYSEYYNFLKDQGLLILGEDFNFDGTLEGFQSAIETTKNNMANQGAMMIWNQLPDDYKLVLEHGLSGGNDINAVKEVISSQTNLDNLDIEDESTQERILESYLRRTTKYNDSRISRSIARLRNSGELEEEAESALNELKEIYKEEREALVQQEMQRKQENQQRLQESYSNFSQVVEDMGLPESKKKRLVNSVWTVGDYGEYKDVSYFNYVDYQIKSNPEHLAQLAELYLDYDPERGFSSEKARKRAKSEVTKTFRDSIDNLSKTKSRTKSGKTHKPKTQAKDVDLLEQILNQNK